jgi:glycine betaine/proline transport system permease protein
MSSPVFDYVMPLEDWIQTAVDWLVAEWRPMFQAIRWPVAYFLDNMEAFLLQVPFAAFLLVLFFLAWRAAGWRVGLFSVAAMFFIGLIGLWAQSMTTLAMIFTALVFNVMVGVPLGILAGRSDRVWTVLRPILDIMQTTPSFVYLVPVVMLFGVGTVPGVIATIIFSLAPVIRMTNLGIRQVTPEVVEAGHAYGATGWQLLRDIQFPLALPTIMAGLNQTLLLGMVMGTIASMIGAEGLGLTVLRGIGRLDVGLAATGGISIVLMAIVLDRITQAMGQRRKHAAPQGTTFKERLLQAIFGGAFRHQHS